MIFDKCCHIKFLALLGNCWRWLLIHKECWLSIGFSCIYVIARTLLILIGIFCRWLCGSYAFLFQNIFWQLSYQLFYSYTFSLECRKNLSLTFRDFHCNVFQFLLTFLPTKENVAIANLLPSMCRSAINPTRHIKEPSQALR